MKRSPFRIHLRHSVFVYAAPVLALLTFLLTASESYPFVATHGNLAASLASTSGVLAPVLAGLAAWDGIRDDRHGGGSLIDTAAQPYARQLFVQSAAGLFYVAATVVVVVAALYIRTMWFTLSGTPMVLQLGVTLVVCLIATTQGYIFAGILRHWSAVIVAPLLPLIAYGLTFFRLPSVVASSLVPFGDRTSVEFMDSNTWFFVGQLTFLAGMLVGLLAAMALASSRDRWVGLVGAVAGVALIAGGVVAVDKQNGVWATESTDVADHLEAFEARNGNLRLNLLPHYAPIADEILATWSRTQQLFSQTPLAFRELSQVSDSHPVEQSQTLSTIYLNPASRTPATESVLASLIDVLSPDCAENSTLAFTLVTFWLAGPGAESTSMLSHDAYSALATLRSMSDDEGALWMAEHFDSFVNCSLNANDLPAA